MFPMLSRAIRAGALSMALASCAAAPSVVRPGASSVRDEAQRFLELHASLYRGQYALMAASDCAHKFS